MKLVRVFLFNNKILIADRCVVGDSFMVRLKGLMGKNILNSGEALWLPRCSSIHMWFMKISIDVLFLKKIKSPENPRKNLFKVLSTRSHLKPWKFFPAQNIFADDVIELKSGEIEKFNIQKGDLVCIESSF